MPISEALARRIEFRKKLEDSLNCPAGCKAQLNVGDNTGFYCGDGSFNWEGIEYTGFCSACSKGEENGKSNA